jgi:hypothetical protein
MLKRIFYSAFLLVITVNSFAQQKKPVIDSTDYYNDLFNELDNFLDSLTAPRTFFLANIGFTNSNFNYTTRNNTAIEGDRKLNITPSLGFYHKSGLGLNASASITHDGDQLNPFQYLLTGSYDYLKDMKFITGLSYTRFFTKDSLPFYTSPLQNEAAAYFTYKKAWLKPSLTATYGWGSRTAYEERKETIKILRGPNQTSYTTIATKENVSDFTLAASLRHDFYWLDKLGAKSSLRFTPQLTFTSGTQRFGFNQTSNSYILPRKTATNILYNSDNVTLDDQSRFQPLSLTAFFKSEVSWGKFYVQPQVGLDYYFPAKQNNFSTAFTLNVGAMF